MAKQNETELPLVTPPPGQQSGQGAVVEPEGEEEGNARRMDTELRLLGQIIRQFDQLQDDAARARVMTYLHSRFVGEEQP